MVAEIDVPVGAIGERDIGGRAGGGLGLRVAGGRLLADVVRAGGEGGKGVDALVVADDGGLAGIQAPLLLASR